MPARTRLPAHIRKLIPSAALEDRRPRAETMRLTLPFPPSVNNLYPTIVTKSGTPRRFKSKAAKVYDAAVKEAVSVWMFRHQMQPPAAPWAISLVAYPPQDRYRHDLSNLLKAPEDALMAAIGGDDNAVDLWIASKRPADPRPRIELVLETTTPRDSRAAADGEE